MMAVLALGRDVWSAIHFARLEFFRAEVAHTSRKKDVLTEKKIPHAALIHKSEQLLLERGMLQSIVDISEGAHADMAKIRIKEVSYTLKPDAL